ncbi:hypothetical protein DVS28_a0535 [Euzebya pacifica]|uniref:Uncharacterized protein n=1 Tax=Euzebya pacifica TaxID=1608957 RepID=A0A346XSP5_9ACTN|nr:hypothetical protein DVS28_a0535 [Euzebya pacifica]
MVTPVPLRVDDAGVDLAPEEEVRPVGWRVRAAFCSAGTTTSRAIRTSRFSRGSIAPTVPPGPSDAGA